MSFRGNYYQKWRKDAASEERIDGERVWGTMYMYSKPTASNAVAAAGKQQTERTHSQLWNESTYPLKLGWDTGNCQQSTNERGESPSLAKVVWLCVYQKSLCIVSKERSKVGPVRQTRSKSSNCGSSSFRWRSLVVLFAFSKSIWVYLQPTLSPLLKFTRALLVSSSFFNCLYPSPWLHIPSLKKSLVYTLPVLRRQT